MTMRVWMGLTVAVISMVILASAWIWNTRGTTTTVSADLPPEFPTDGFSHRSFESLLSEFVDSDGRVNYETWHADPAAREALDRYVAAIGAFSPDNSPDRFPQHADQVAYWIYAYNALVLKAVLDRWPLESVTDIKAPVEIIEGLGFFYNLKFVVGGESMSLYELEHDRVVPRAQDPRVHFVLNCASGSCPAARPRLPTGDELEPFLAQAARDFVADPKNVTVDHSHRKLILSKIFKWYESDFLDELRHRGRPASVVGYISLVAPKAVRADLARATSYEVTYREYDWAVNRSQK